MGTITAPIEGQTYVSQTDPRYRLYIEHVGHADDGFGGYFIEAVPEADRGDMGAIGYDISNEEWEALVRDRSLVLAT